MTAFLLLGPATPMLFQGQEFGASSPFLYFADHQGELANQVAEGRRKFLSQFEAMVQFRLLDDVAVPNDLETFTRCKLSSQQREACPELVALHRDLIAMRRRTPAFSQHCRDVDGAILGSDAFVLRFFADGADDRLLIVNFGRELRLTVAPEPLLAPTEDAQWTMAWSSEDNRYGGAGHGPLESEDGWHFPGETAIVLAPLN
jgi:maltooligosyltrehalose trehalohydrolase